MEVAGLLLGVAGLAATFETFLQGFDLVDQGKHYARDSVILLTRLDAQREIFKIWGRALEQAVSENPATATRLLDEDLQRLLKRHLDCICMIFQDAFQLSEKYGLRKVDQRMDAKPALSIRAHLRWFQRDATFGAKAKWAIHNKKKFKNMLEDLKELITELREITSSIADLEKQREVFVREINECTTTDKLEILEEALIEEDPSLSDAASQRIAALTDAAVSLRSFTGKAGVRENGFAADDMETEADLGPDAQSPLYISQHGLNEVFLAKSSEPSSRTSPRKLDECLKGVVYGHQNNLEITQQDDGRRITNVMACGWKTRLQIETGVWKSTTAKRVMYELRNFQTHGKETPFISLGLFEELEGNRNQLVCHFSPEGSGWMLTCGKHILRGSIQAPVRPIHL